MNKKIKLSLSSTAVILFSLCLAIFNLFSANPISAAGHDLSQQVGKLNIKNLDHPQENENRLFCDGDRLQLTFTLGEKQIAISKDDYLDLSYQVHDAGQKESDCLLLPFQESGSLFLGPKKIGRFYFTGHHCYLNFDQVLSATEQKKIDHFSFVLLARNLSGKNTAIDLGSKDKHVQFYLQKNTDGKSSFLVRKNGLLANGQVNWTNFINLSAGKADASAAYRLREEVDAQQEIDPSSLTITDLQTNKIIPHAADYLKQSKQSFALLLPKDKFAGKLLKISYRTKIDEKAKKDPTSTTKTEAPADLPAFKETAQPVLQFKQEEPSLCVLTISSWAEAANGQKLPLAGHQFTILPLSVAAQSWQRAAATDENGQAQLKDLPEGAYLIKPEAFNDQVELAQPQLVQLNKQHPQTNVQFMHHLKEKTTKEDKQEQSKKISTDLLSHISANQLNDATRSIKRAPQTDLSAAKQGTKAIKKGKKNAASPLHKIKADQEKRQKVKAKRLPQTGRQNNLVLLFTGLVICGLATIIVLTLRQNIIDKH